ncbi:MAG TPA: hypothetical protein VLF94_03305 [Chlamydiales bacterium]|nr:hypothetical protein [Chlamydiales bacterium]
MKNFVFCFVLFASLLFGNDFRLKERLEKAKNGDYIVAEAGKMITLLAVRSSTPNTLILEEISAPVNNLKKRPASWGEWVKAKAPGHTSWSMIEIDLQTGQVLECYSFSRSAWVQVSQNESLIATLLQLPMKAIAEDKRKRIGPPPLDGQSDFRKLWNPPLIFEGKKVEVGNFDVYETTWPKDGSELANQLVSLYFDKEKRFPLPFWVQVDTAHATAAMRTIDSGKNLPSVHRSLPRRVPEFVGSPQKTENGLRLSLKSPKYYRQFELFAIDVTTKEKQICPITHSLIQGDEELITIEIDREDLKETLEPDHRYTWLLVPVGHSESYTETRKPFLWNQN